MNTCIDTNCHYVAATPKRTASTASALLSRLTKRWLDRRQNRKNRRALQPLLSLDEKMLKDIGITRGDLSWARNLPDSLDASVELEIVARRHKRPVS